METFRKTTAAAAILILVAVGISQSTSTQTDDSPPQMRRADRIRIAEGFRIAGQLQNELWTGWDEAPFAVLLVTPEHEFLLRHSSPTEDFVSIGFDSLLDSEVFCRERVFSETFLASFPAVGGVPTVVIGQPENTGKSSAAWTATLLHEHFHQLQMSTPGYYEAVDALQLSGGDETGMWMLDYPFPYDSTAIGGSFSRMCKRLHGALGSIGTDRFAELVAEYLEARAVFAGMLAPADYRYFSFQSWQEGVARYTEYRMAQLAGESYEATADFRELEDFLPLVDLARKIREDTLQELEQLSLEEFRRVAFYPVGAGEALLLDEVNPEWRAGYFSEWFALEKLFPR